MRISIVLVLVHILIIPGILAKKDCRERLQRCENKKIPHRKQVCGTDNKTYPNRCALLREQCAQNSALTVKHEGKCKEKQPCWMAQGKKVAKSSGKNSKDGAEYTPECLEDGTFAPVQCQIGYCYCVTSNGRIIPGTSVRHKKIECPKRGRNNLSNGEDGGNSSKSGCDQTNRSIFTKNLVRIFKTEYNRRDLYGRYFSVPESYQNISNVELQAIEWKFTSLDIDRNNSLSKNEYKDLRGLIRKAVKPKRCSRKFIRLCDLDRNSLISKQEWINCLNISNTEPDGEETRKAIVPDDTSEETEIESEEAEVPEPEHDPARVLEESVLPLSEHSPDTEKEHESKINDCFSDRKSVLDEQRLGSQPTYIPECTDDGRYKKVQCFPSTGYCWCVAEDSGKPIPGTSVRNLTPKCDLIQNASPPMKGCPDHKRIAFVKSLIEFFHRNISETSAAEELPLHDVNGHEQIVSRGFHSLDTNKNKALDRKEWKIFRSMVATINKNLKKCGRKFLRYCDANQDNKVSITEWLLCTNTQNITTQEKENHSNSSIIRRRGPNPVEAYLKGDD